MDPDAMVEVEVLDVNDAEARALLLAIDPLVQLAGYEADTLAHLRDLAERDSRAVAQLWAAFDAANAATRETAHKIRLLLPPTARAVLVIIACPDEPQQLALLRRLQKEGLKCQAKTPHQSTVDNYQAKF